MKDMTNAPTPGMFWAAYWTSFPNPNKGATPAGFWRSAIAEVIKDASDPFVRCDDFEGRLERFTTKLQEALDILNEEAKA